jgi:hypothetical protein
VSNGSLSAGTYVHQAVKPVLSELIETCKLLKEEKKITSLNLALVLVHDLLFAKGIQAGDGPIKQAVLRHKCVVNIRLAVRQPIFASERG